jgi:hypothetical protein
LQQVQPDGSDPFTNAFFWRRKRFSVQQEKNSNNLVYLSKDKLFPMKSINPDDFKVVDKISCQIANNLEIGANDEKDRKMSLKN